MEVETALVEAVQLDALQGVRIGRRGRLVVVEIEVCGSDWARYEYSLFWYVKD